MDFFFSSTGTGIDLPGLPSSPHQLVRNDGNGVFTNIAEEAGLPSYEWGWSNALVDFDNDRNLDLIWAGFSINVFLNWGKVRLFMGDGTGGFSETEDCEPNNCTPCLAFGAFGRGVQPNLCFEEAGCDNRRSNGLWSDDFEFCNDIAVGCDGCYPTSSCSSNTCTPDLGIQLASSATGSITVGDFDGDGFDDMAIMTSDYSTDYAAVFGTEPQLMQGAVTHVVLLRNKGESGNNSVKFKLVATSGGNRDGIGSRLTLTDACGEVQYQEARTPLGPFAPAPRFPSFGLGSAKEAEVIVRWHPSGNEEKFCVSASTSVTELVEGDGRSTNGSCGNVSSSGCGGAAASVGSNGNGNKNL
jgi:hypothetical protein